MKEPNNLASIVLAAIASALLLGIVYFLLRCSASDRSRFADAALAAGLDAAQECVLGSVVRCPTQRGGAWDPDRYGACLFDDAFPCVVQRAIGLAVHAARIRFGPQSFMMQSSVLSPCDHDEALDCLSSADLLSCRDSLCVESRVTVCMRQGCEEPNR